MTIQAFSFHYIGLILALTSWTTLGQVFQPGALDTTYQPALNGAVQAIAPLPDGKALVGGGFTTVNGSTHAGIVRLNGDGTVDETFQIGSGIAGTTNAIVAAIVLQSDGKAVVGGNFTQINGVACTNLARLNADGSVDTNFTAQCAPILCLTLTPDGKILYGGQGEDVGSSACLGRLSASGQADPDFQNPTLFGYSHAWSQIWPTVTHIASLTNGQILIQGFFAYANNLPYYGLARLQANGSVDTNFPCLPQGDRTLAGPSAAALPDTGALAILSDGRILVGGNEELFEVWEAPARRLVRLSSEGILDESYLPEFPVKSRSFSNSIPFLKVLDGDKIFVSGDFVTVAGQPRNHFARLTAAGNLDFEFDASAGFDRAISALATQPDGKFLVGGAFTNANGAARAYLVRWHGESDSIAAPVILTQPAGTNALAGQTINLFASAAGGHLAYRWRHDGADLDGATNALLSLTNVQFADAGAYTVAVTNSAGQAASAAATLTVTSLGEALNAPELSFTSWLGFWYAGYWSTETPGRGWYYQTNQTHDGAGAIQSETRDRPAELAPYSVLQTTVQGPGIFSFWWKAVNMSSLIEFNVSDATSLRLQTDTGMDLQQTMVDVPAGQHLLTWKAYCPTDAEIVLDDFQYIAATPGFQVNQARLSAETGFQCPLRLNATNEVFRLEWSEDLKTWTTLTTVSNFQKDMLITDPGATNRSHSFYRAVK